MKSLLVQYCGYNLWANTLLTEFIAASAATPTDREVQSSFPTLRKTVFHIWGAETLWLTRLNGSSPGAFPQMEPDFPLARLLESSRNMLAYVESKDEDYFARETAYKNLKGEAFVTVNSGIIMHCMNHSTFHRGQLTTMLHQLGIEKGIPPTDLVAFLRT